MTSDSLSAPVDKGVVPRLMKHPFIEADGPLLKAEDSRDVKCTSNDDQTEDPYSHQPQILRIRLIFP